VMGGMRARRYGRIVNVSSVAALGNALPGNAFYAGTKGEVVILTRRFAMELGPDGITVDAVAPGFVRTDMTQRGRGAADWRGTEERLAARAMMGRIGEPDDIANPHWKPSREPHLRSRLTVDRRERSTPGAFARPPKTRRAVELSPAEAESQSAAALRVCRRDLGREELHWVQFRQEHPRGVASISDW